MDLLVVAALRIGAALLVFVVGRLVANWIVALEAGCAQPYLGVLRLARLETAPTA
jgi:hypothetical protein